VQARPGIRVPGVWDPFEGVVRAILGQQVSVARARILAQSLCAAFGDGTFPDAAALAEAEVAAIGMPGVRGRAVSTLARRVCEEGDRWLHDAAGLRRELIAVRGVGPWTAEYAAMRIGRDPDAFPDTDWGVFKALGAKGPAARARAEPWRPWRAYATMLLWSSRSG
jgi:3-methyladenine DNA glycosylase/8-oxoguanine DNA glycosylase